MTVCRCSQVAIAASSVGSMSGMGSWEPTADRGGLSYEALITRCVAEGRCPPRSLVQHEWPTTTLMSYSPHRNTSGPPPPTPVRRRTTDHARLVKDERRRANESREKLIHRAADQPFSPSLPWSRDHHRLVKPRLIVSTSDTRRTAHSRGGDMRKGMHH